MNYDFDKVIDRTNTNSLKYDFAVERGRPADVLPLLKETFAFVADYEGEVPGTTPRDCGTCLLHDLPMARYEAAKYLHEVLECATEENLNYPL